ncbi:hypothetical protein E1287_17605 [Actinomadura sp. KC06]|nr:hypothetical protein E1287_17605 [Actinomadura sp. KC06]
MRVLAAWLSTFTLEGTEGESRRCPGCGNWLPGWLRRDARFCSAACRARHWRWVRRSRAWVAVILHSSPATRAVCPEWNRLGGRGLSMAVVVERVVPEVVAGVLITRSLSPAGLNRPRNACPSARR